MSLSRLALRLAAVEALCPSSVIETGPYPTWAGKRVYDSKITPLADADGWKNFIAEVQGQPILTLYTEEQESEPTTGEYPADREIVDLVVEVMIAAGRTVTVEGPDGQPMDVGAIEAAITSAQIEAMLDQIEQQVRNFLDPMSPVCPHPYNKVARELHHVKSAPLRDAVGRLSRVAERTLTFKLRIRHTQPYGNPRLGVAADIAGLPEPLLAVALALPATGAAGQLIRQIARGQAPPPALTPLDDIRIFSNLDRAAAPTTTACDLESDVNLQG